MPGVFGPACPGGVKLKLDLRVANYAHFAGQYDKVTMQNDWYT